MTHPVLFNTKENDFFTTGGFLKTVEKPPHPTKWSQEKPIPPGAWGGTPHTALGLNGKKTSPQPQRDRKGHTPKDPPRFPSQKGGTHKPRANSPKEGKRPGPIKLRKKRKELEEALSWLGKPTQEKDFNWKPFPYWKKDNRRSNPTPYYR